MNPDMDPIATLGLLLLLIVALALRVQKRRQAELRKRVEESRTFRRPNVYGTRKVATSRDDMKKAGLL